MPYEPRLTQALRALLHSRRVAALGTIGDNGAPFVSMVPYALEPSLCSLVIHVSGLAAHTGYLQARPRVSMLVMQGETPGEPVHALPRVTLEGEARELTPDSASWQACRTAYLKRFPEAEPMTQLDDFRFVAIALLGARQVAGFGAARSVDREQLCLALQASDQG